MGRHSDKKSQALLLIGYLCHLLHRMDLLVWKQFKIMAWRDRVFFWHLDLLFRPQTCRYLLFQNIASKSYVQSVTDVIYLFL